MSTDEKSLRIARPHLNPGENLLWAGRTAARRAASGALGIAAVTFLFFLTFGAIAAFGSWRMDRETAQFWAAHPHPGWTRPASGMSFLDPLVFFGGFGVFAGATFGGFYCAFVKPMTYAITDHRILFLATTGSEAVPIAAYGPEDVQFVRRQDHRDGTSDLFISDTAQPTRGTLEINGIPVPFRPRSPGVGLRGIADADAVEPLISALRAGRLAGVAPVSPESLPVDLPREQEIILKKSRIPWMAGATFFLGGLPFLGFGIAAGLGLTSVQSGEGASATPASPLVGLLSFGGIGLACSLLGTLLLLWRDGFTADRATQTYRMQRGFVPFARPVSGPFDDFDRIRLTREDDNSESGYSISWHARLLWKEPGRKPYDILATPFEPHGAGEALRMAAALGLPLEDLSAGPTPAERKARTVR